MPIQIFNPAGGMIFNSDACVNGVCGGSFFIPAGASFYRQWPTLIGCTLRVVFHHQVDVLDSSSYAKGISYPSGVPTIALVPNAIARFMTVWVVGGPTIQSIPGVQALGSNGGVAISPAARGMNYIGRAAFARNDPRNLPFDGSGGTSNAGIQYYRIAYPEEPLFAVRLDDNRSVSLTVVTQVSSGVWEIGVTCKKVAPDPDYWRSWWSHPVDVYCFARPTSPQASPQFALWAADGSLAYDLARPGLLVAQALCEFGQGPAVNGSLGITAPVPVSRTSVMGVIGVPNYAYEDYVYNGDDQDGGYGGHTWSSGSAAWQWSSGGLAMTYAWRQTQLVYYSPGGSRGNEFYEVFVPSTAIVVDLTGL